LKPHKYIRQSINPDTEFA